MNNKILETVKSFDELSVNPEVFISPSKNFRSRIEFGYKNDCYTMMDGESQIFFSKSNVPIEMISNNMESILHDINCSKTLKNKLFGINYRSNNVSTICTLIYHRPLDEKWLLEIKNIEDKYKNIFFVGRSKGKIYGSSNEYWSNVMLNNEYFWIKQDDESFFQPNFYLMPRMINFICKNLSINYQSSNLLELYCGCGTFTLPLSKYFNYVFATENNRKAISHLHSSIKKNNFKNINIARLSDLETIEAFGGKTFRRLNNFDLKSYKFDTILVDPPRSGLSPESIDFIKKFEQIIYISCNSETFFRDLKLLNKKIIESAIFDQFVNTQHIELIGILND